MKKPVKITLLSLAGLFLLLVLALAANPLWLGAFVRCVATTVAPCYTGTGLTLKSCSINAYTGKISLEGFALKNPKGYDTDDAVSFESLDVDLSVPSLLSDKIRIHEIKLEKPFVSYVFDDDGTNNFVRIIDAVKAKTGDSEEKEEKDDEKAGKKVVIDRLEINGTKVKYRKVTLPIPVPTLTKIGYTKDDEKKDEKKTEEASGATFEEVGDAVWETVKDKFTDVGGVIGSAAGAVGEGAANALKGAADAVVGDGAKAATEAAGKAAEAATDAVKDGAKAVGEGLKKLNPFGK